MNLFQFCIISSSRLSVSTFKRASIEKDAASKRWHQLNADGDTDEASLREDEYNNLLELWTNFNYAIYVLAESDSFSVIEKSSMKG